MGCKICQKTKERTEDRFESFSKPTLGISTEEEPQAIKSASLIKYINKIYKNQNNASLTGIMRHFTRIWNLKIKEKSVIKKLIEFSRNIIKINTITM